MLASFFNCWTIAFWSSSKSVLNDSSPSRAAIMALLTFEIVETIYKPKQYLENLLNEIRLSKLTSTIKGVPSLLFFIYF